MPLVRISLRQGTSPEYRKAIADGVHRAMVESITIPPGDRFQVVTEHTADGLIYDASYLGGKPQQKRALFRRMAEILKESPGLRPQDLLVNLVEVSWENWSFGNGEAQYMDS